MKITRAFDYVFKRLKFLGFVFLCVLILICTLRQLYIEFSFSLSMNIQTNATTKIRPHSSNIIIIII